jgi:hypothetical protein
MEICYVGSLDPAKPMGDSALEKSDLQIFISLLYHF